MIEKRCNLNCSFCYHNQFGKENQFIANKQDYLGVIMAMKNAGIKQVILSGGEPLLSLDLFNIIKLLEEHDFIISICTNAILATPQLCNRLLQTSVKKLTVNLAALCDDTGMILNNNNAICAIQGIRNLVTTGFLVTLNNILRTTTTKDSIEQNIECACKWGAKSISFTVPICKCSCVPNETIYSLNNYQVEKFQDYFEEIENKVKPKINIEFQYPKCNSDDCPAQKEIWGVSADGVFSTCLVKQYQTWNK